MNKFISKFFTIYIYIIHHFSNPRKRIEKKFIKKLGYKPDLDNPSTFNEKIQWLKLHDKNPIYTTIVDKYEVKSYVATLVGEKFVIPTLGVWDSFDDIDFNKLPNQFVLKCTHDSGGIIICKDKNNFDIKKAKKIINRALKFNHYYWGFEWPYKNVKKRIIAEKYLNDPEHSVLPDYKFFCFKGIPKFFKIDFNRTSDHHANYYDLDWNLLPFGEFDFPPSSSLSTKRPANFTQMIDIASQLSKNFEFLRVDMYNIDGEIFFGELTLYPSNGFGQFTDFEWDCKLGEQIQLKK